MKITTLRCWLNVARAQYALERHPAHDNGPQRRTAGDWTEVIKQVA